MRAKTIHNQRATAAATSLCLIIIISGISPLLARPDQSFVRASPKKLALSLQQSPLPDFPSPPSISDTRQQSSQQYQLDPHNARASSDIGPSSPSTTDILKDVPLTSFTHEPTIGSRTSTTTVTTTTANNNPNDEVSSTKPSISTPVATVTTNSTPSLVQTTTLSVFIPDLKPTSTSSYESIHQDRSSSSGSNNNSGTSNYSYTDDEDSVLDSAAFANSSLISQFNSTSIGNPTYATNKTQNANNRTLSSGTKHQKNNSSLTITGTSAKSTSIVHPLLIYSIRYEIRSYDLFGSTTNSLTSFEKRSSMSNQHGGSSQTFEQPASVARHSRTLIAGLKNTIGLDFYYSDSESFIFWTDVIEERIYRGTITNGSINNVETIVQTGLATAEGLAVDWIGRNIYWVESTLDHIEVASMNGTSRRTLIAGDMESPRAIAVDPRHGLLFWTDWDKKSPRIERATMSGDDRKTLVYIKEINGGWPNGLTLDYENLKVYWIDANSDSIHAVDYQGLNHQPLLKHFKSLGHPFSITLFDNNLYWTDWKTNSISTANKRNGSDARELQRLTSRLFDIKVFHPSRQPRIDDSLNPCFTNRGNCSHLCLLSTNYTRKCECPPLMKLASDNKTCETDERVLLIGKTNEIRVVDMSEPLHQVMSPISVPKVFIPKQFEFDAKSKTIFWADSQTNEVKRAQLAGNSIETIIDVIIESPSGLALDWISGNIYVTSSSQFKSSGKIFISNLNGEYISILMDSAQGIVSPKSLAVHPVLGFLFCLDETMDTSEPVIFVASMDGRNKRVISTTATNPLLVNPSNLAIDYELNRVYWINQASNTTGNASIQYYDIVTDTVVTMLNEKDVQSSERLYPGVLCVDGDFLLMSGRVPTEAIIKISKYNPEQRTIMRTQNLDQVSALKVYNASSQTGTNACIQNDGNCSQLCVPTNSTHRVCKCTMGFKNNPLNETECLGKDEFLIFSYNLGMKGISLEPNSSPDDYYLPPIHRAFRASSIDYVHRDNLIYWVDNEEGSITRINRDTTNYQVIVQGLESEESIALDWVAGNIYWLDPYYDTIEVAHLNGSNRFVIVNGDMDKANGIVVNPISGYIVWSDIGTVPKIETAKLDGSNRRVIVSHNLAHVDDLAIDYIDDYIYWVDSTLSLIERIRDDGTERQVVYSGGGNSGISHGPQNHLVSIAIHEDYLFIADSLQHQGSIIRCNKEDSSNQTIIQQHLGDGIRDITIFAKQPLPSPEQNPCIKNNGGCQDLCLYLGEKGKKRCICSHGKLNQDEMTCKPYDTFVLFSKLSQIDSLHIREDESINNPPYLPIANENRNNIIALTVDYSAKRIIYSEISHDQICSVFFNGTDKRVLVEKQSLVEGIAFANDQLYWTSVPGNSISRLNVSSSGVIKKNCDNSVCKTATVEKIVELTSEDKPRGIAIDSCTAYVYWTNWNANASIQRASPHNGYKIESIIKTGIKVPNGIAIDQKQRKLYWCDAKLDKIESCDMDGSNRKVLMPASPQHPFALAVWDSYVFWTDWLARGVFRADKYTGQQPVQIKKVLQRPMGIVVAAPEVSECPIDRCNTVANGGCPEGYTCIQHHSESLSGQVQLECRPNVSHELSIPASRCLRYSPSGLCEHMTYHDIIMDIMDRYNVTELMPQETKVLKPISSENASLIEAASTINSSGSQIPKATTQLIPISTSTMIHNHTSYSTTISESISTTTKIPTTAHVSHKENMKPTSQNPKSIDYSTPVISSTPEPFVPPTGDSSKKNQVDNTSHESSSSITSSPPTPPQAALTNATTATPCQAALQPTKDAILNNECKLANEFKCYLSEKLVCISADRRCDGNHDCPSKEDENDCHLSKSPYNLKSETNWHRFVTVILIILAATVAALFLVFGTRGRRRWFVGTNGAFNHRRMFDNDNGTNIEISNPMFDEDDSGNLVHCAYSIDLNERTTNFSNPLYERQILLMNDKHVSPVDRR